MNADKKWFNKPALILHTKLRQKNRNTCIQGLLAIIMYSEIHN